MAFDAARPKASTSVVVNSRTPTAEILRLVVNFTLVIFHADVTPVVRVGEAWILELFHGPTFAFKDVALQVQTRARND